MKVENFLKELKDSTDIQYKIMKWLNEKTNLRVKPEKYIKE